MSEILFYVFVLTGTLALSYFPVRFCIWVVRSWTKASKKPIRKTKKRTLVKTR